METLKTSSALHKCGHCQRLLPSDAFYRNGRTGKADRMCKNCRKIYSRHYRKQTVVSSMIDNSCLILTQLPPGELRHQLLHRAMDVVRQHYARRRNRMNEDE